MSDGGTWIWTLSQRRALVVVLGLLLLLIAWRAFRNPTYVSDPPPSRGMQADALQDRLDPNIASRAEISALPLVGEKKAGDIVIFREQFMAAHPGQLAFASPHDLERVRGIGPATVERLTPYLTFPQVSTRPGR